jgi:type I restriction enzyme R subunit
MDRKDLDYQTMKEYQRFSPDSVNGSDSTAALKRNLEKDDNKIIVTTIQKLNHLMKSESVLPIYGKQVVFIFDECHRSQFGEAQANLKRNSGISINSGSLELPSFPRTPAAQRPPPVCLAVSFIPTSSPMRSAMKRY